MFSGCNHPGPELLSSALGLFYQNTSDPGRISTDKQVLAPQSNLDQSISGSEPNNTSDKSPTVPGSRNNITSGAMNLPSEAEKSSIADAFNEAKSSSFSSILLTWFPGKQRMLLTDESTKSASTMAAALKQNEDNILQLKGTIVELLLKQDIAKVLEVYHSFFNEMFKVIRSVCQKNAFERKKCWKGKMSYADFTPPWFKLYIVNNSHCLQINPINGVIGVPDAKKLRSKIGKVRAVRILCSFYENEPNCIPFLRKSVCDCMKLIIPSDPSKQVQHINQTLNQTKTTSPNTQGDKVQSSVIEAQNILPNASSRSGVLSSSNNSSRASTLDDSQESAVSADQQPLPDVDQPSSTTEQPMANREPKNQQLTDSNQSSGDLSLENTPESVKNSDPQHLLQVQDCSSIPLSHGNTKTSVSQRLSGSDDSSIECPIQSNQAGDKSSDEQPSLEKEKSLTIEQPMANREPKNQQLTDSNQSSGDLSLENTPESVKNSDPQHLLQVQDCSSIPLSHGNTKTSVSQRLSGSDDSSIECPIQSNQAGDKSSDEQPSLKKEKSLAIIQGSGSDKPCVPRDPSGSNSSSTDNILSNSQEAIDPSRPPPSANVKHSSSKSLFPTTSKHSVQEKSSSAEQLPDLSKETGIYKTTTNQTEISAEAANKPTKGQSGAPNSIQTSVDSQQRYKDDGPIHEDQEASLGLHPNDDSVDLYIVSTDGIEVDNNKKSGDNSIKPFLERNIQTRSSVKEVVPRHIEEREKKMRERKERAARIIQSVKKEANLKKFSKKRSHPGSQQHHPPKKKVRFADEVLSETTDVRVTRSSSERAKRFCRLRKRKQ